MRTLTKKEKILFGVATLALIGVFMLRGGVPLPKFQPLNLGREILLKKKLIAKTLSLLDQKETIKQESRLYAPYVNKSSEDQAPLLLKEIQTFAAATLVELSNVQAAQPKKHDSYIEYTVEVETEATWSQLMTLLYSIHSSKSLLQVDRMRINPKTDKPEFLKVNLSITKSMLF